MPRGTLNHALNGVNLLRSGAEATVYADDVCDGCGSNILHLTFEKDKSPLKDKPEEYAGCILCDEELNAFAEELYAPS